MATQKSHTMTQLCDLTRCCICLKTFTDPRMLPCIHTFCFQCLQDLAEQSNKKPGDQIQCPVCRKEFTLPGDGIQCIQKNFFMASLVEIGNSFNQLNTTLPCDICKANNDASDAQVPEVTMRCLVCQENLCEGCHKLHQSFKISRNHEIRKIGSEVVEEKVLKTFQAMNCDIHCGKPLDYYCADCKKLVCVSCFAESHKAHYCKDVNTVEEEFRQSIKSNANIISALAEEILKKKEKMERKEEFLKKISARENDILHRSKEMKHMIDEHTKSLLSSLDEIKNRHLKEIQMEEEELDRRFQLLDSISRYCDELRSKGSASEVCRSKDELLRTANELEEDHEACIMRPRVSFKVTFQATDLDNWVKKINENIIGMLKAENVEQSEDIGVAICGNDHLYKTNLRRSSETVTRIQDVPPTLTNLFAVAVAVYNNTMFISGVGETGNEIWKYNFASGWNRCGTLARGRTRHCAEFIGEKMYLCGGRVEGVVRDSVEVYNALTENSAMVGRLKVGGEFAACVAYIGSIYVFGGLNKYDQSLDCVQVYNPVNSICTLLSTPLPRQCYFIRSVLWENYAIVLDHDKCFIFDLNERIWQERHQFKANAFLFGMVSENGRIFAVGGSLRDDVKCLRASSILNDEAASWKTCNRLPKTTSVRAVAKLTL